MARVAVCGAVPWPSVRGTIFRTCLVCVLGPDEERLPKFWYDLSKERLQRSLDHQDSTETAKNLVLFIGDDEERLPKFWYDLSKERLQRSLDHQDSTETAKNLVLFIGDGE
ncbi:UNVERIFIED_CONTAM: hypothetical protein FKN15_036170 [Acipenser sinensis]